MSILTFQWIVPVYSERAGILKGFKINEDLKEFFSSWLGSREYPKELEKSLNYPKITEKEQEEHMKSQEAREQPRVTREAILASDAPKLYESNLYKSLLNNEKSRLSTPTTLQQSSIVVPPSIFGNT